jgi:hypothetical protein
LFRNILRERGSHCDVENAVMGGACGEIGSLLTYLSVGSCMWCAHTKIALQMRYQLSLVYTVTIGDWGRIAASNMTARMTSVVHTLKAEHPFNHL